MPRICFAVHIRMIMKSALYKGVNCNIYIRTVNVKWGIKKWVELNIMGRRGNNQHKMIELRKLARSNEDL